MSVAVLVGEGESVEHALKQFKRRMTRSGILRDVKAKRHYLKPSEAKRVKRAEAARKRRKASRPAE